MNKKAHLRELYFVSEAVIAAKIECTICERTIAHEAETGTAEDARTAVASEAYKAGWRQSTSKTFGQVGITCPTCLKDPMNECTVK